MMPDPELVPDFEDTGGPGKDWQFNPDPDGFVPVIPHKIIVVCPTALRRRTRFHMGLVRRRARRILCPGCGRKAFWEVVTTTSRKAGESADFDLGPA